MTAALFFYVLLLVLLYLMWIAVAVGSFATAQFAPGAGAQLEKRGLGLSGIKSAELPRGALG